MLDYLVPRLPSWLDNLLCHAMYWTAVILNIWYRFWEKPNRKNNKKKPTKKGEK